MWRPGSYVLLTDLQQQERVKGLKDLNGWLVDCHHDCTPGQRNIAHSAHHNGCSTSIQACKTQNRNRARLVTQTWHTQPSMVVVLLTSSVSQTESCNHTTGAAADRKPPVRFLMHELLALLLSASSASSGTTRTAVILVVLGYTQHAMPTLLPQRMSSSTSFAICTVLQCIPACVYMRSTGTAKHAGQLRPGPHAVQGPTETYHRAQLT